MTNGMAFAIAVATEQNMAHSTPLHSYTGVTSSCGCCGHLRIRNEGDLRGIGFGDLR
jgi:hypothetical protein